LHLTECLQLVQNPSKCNVYGDSRDHPDVVGEGPPTQKFEAVFRMGGQPKLFVDPLKAVFPKLHHEEITLGQSAAQALCGNIPKMSRPEDPDFSGRICGHESRF
jgi:hypothetical protein